MKRTDISDWSLPPACFNPKKEQWLESYAYVNGQRVVWLCEDADNWVIG